MPGGRSVRAVAGSGAGPFRLGVAITPGFHVGSAAAVVVSVPGVVLPIAVLHVIKVSCPGVCRRIRWIWGLVSIVRMSVVVVRVLGRTKGFLRGLRRRWTLQVLLPVGWHCLSSGDRRGCGSWSTWRLL